MSHTTDNRLTSLASLQVIAIFVVVFGHLVFPTLHPELSSANSYVMGVAVSFCFIYSGFFTARKHDFGKGYGIKDHLRFMLKKIANFYPTYVLALLLCIIGLKINNLLHFNAKLLIAHLTMTNTFVPSARYYFGYNAVGWFICDLFFLYLMAPVVVKFLRSLSLRLQLSLIALALALQLAGGYFEIINSYYFYQFPPMRLIDFGTGVILYNVTRSGQWNTAIAWLNSKRATALEIAATLLIFPAGYIGIKVHDPLWFRSYLVSFLPAMLPMTAFVLTSTKPGVISRIISTKPFRSLSTIVMEIYLFQIAIYLLADPILRHIGFGGNNVATKLTIIAIIIIFSALYHHIYTQITRRVPPQTKKFG